MPTLQWTPTTGGNLMQLGESLRSPGLQKIVEKIHFHGHPMVRGTHRTTIEITTEPHLTQRGDCIIGVSADKGCLQLSEDLKSAIRRKGSKVSFKFLVESDDFEVQGQGDPGLLLTHPHDMVIRTSYFLSERTLGVGADAAAADIPRSIIRYLQDPNATGTLVIQVQ